MKSQKFWSGNRNNSTSITNKITNVLFIIYLIALCWILLFKLGVRFSYMGKRSVNLMPFNDKIDLGQIISNVIIFVPLGIYAGVLFKRWTLGNRFFFCFLTSLTIEGLQFVCRVGAFDITDIITNVLGGVIGLMLFEVIEKLFNNSVKSQKFINIVAAIGTILMISLLLLLKLNMLPVRYQ